MKNVVISVVLLEGYAVYTAIKQHLTVQFSCLHNNMIHHWYQYIYFGEIKNVPALYIERTQLSCYLFRYIASNNKLWVHIFDNVIYNCSEFKTKECNKGARLPMNRLYGNSTSYIFLLQYNYRNVQESLIWSM